MAWWAWFPRGGRKIRCPRPGPSPTVERLLGEGMIMSEAGDTRHSRGSSIRALRRLGPYVKLVRGRMIASGLAVLLSMTCGLTIPLVFQRILDGPVANKDTGPLLWLVLLVAVLG